MEIEVIRGDENKSLRIRLKWRIIVFFQVWEDTVGRRRQALAL